MCSSKNISNIFNVRSSSLSLCKRASLPRGGAFIDTEGKGKHPNSVLRVSYSRHSSAVTALTEKFTDPIHNVFHIQPLVVLPVSSSHKRNQGGT